MGSFGEKSEEKEEDFYFDEASRMFIRRGDKPPRTDRQAGLVEKEATTNAPSLNPFHCWRQRS